MLHGLTCPQDRSDRQEAMDGGRRLRWWCAYVSDICRRRKEVESRAVLFSAARGTVKVQLGFCWYSHATESCERSLSFFFF